MTLVNVEVERNTKNVVGDFMSLIKDIFDIIKKKPKVEEPEFKCTNTETLCIHINPLPCEPNPFFRSKESSARFFSDFEIRVTTIYRYYNMNDTFLREYLTKSREALQSTKNSGEEFDMYSSCFFINNNSFKDIHYMSALMNLYMAFETLLKNVTKDVAYDSGVKIEEIQERNLPYLNSYFFFLEDKFKSNLQMTSKEKEFINIIRKIRNDYLHDSTTTIPDGMERDIVKLFNLREGKRITVDDTLINNTFEIFCQIGEKLQTAYIAYKKIYLKNYVK